MDRIAKIGILSKVVHTQKDKHYIFSFLSFTLALDYQIYISFGIFTKVRTLVKFHRERYVTGDRRQWYKGE